MRAVWVIGNIKLMENRYNRHLIIDGFLPKHQKKIANSSVLIIGAGGLGSPVSQYLTAAGVGKITIIDNDIVSVSNLQRQILYTENDIGKPKVLVAKERLKKLNSNVKIKAIQSYFSVSNAEELTQPADIIIDACDNFETRYLINDICIKLNKPFIYGSIENYTGQVAVFNYKNNSATYRCLYPEPPKEKIQQTTGVLSPLPGIIGSYQAAEVIKIITGLGTVLANQLLLINVYTNTHIVLNIEPKKESNP